MTVWKCQLSAQTRNFVKSGHRIVLLPNYLHLIRFYDTYNISRIETFMAESFVKAIYDYHSNETGDLDFEAGAIIKILNRVDDNWISGEHDGKIGLFPAKFVEPTSVALSDSVEKTVVAKETYISGEDGILTYFLGDVITFLGFVDDYWCQGSFGGEVGLFPAFTVDGLDESSHSITSKTSAVFKPNGPGEALRQSAPLAEQVRSEGPSAEALFEFQGLSDFELNFPTGATILLTKDVDVEWFEGSYRGRSGVFPKSFVKVLVPLPEEVHADAAGISVPHAIAVYPFVGETAMELSFREGDIIYLHDWVSLEWFKGEIDGTTGIFPSSFVQIQVELPQMFPAFSSSEPEWAKRNELEDSTGRNTPDSSFKIGDTALAIYGFTTNTTGDLTLEVGDLITIENIIDEEWVEGRKNGTEVGLCPAVFLELKEEVNKSDNETKEHSFVKRNESAPSAQAVQANQLGNANDLHAPVVLNHSVVSQGIPNIVIQNTNHHTPSREENIPQNIAASSSAIPKFSTPEIPNRTKPRATLGGTIGGASKIASLEATSNKPPPGPKLVLAPKPPILQKPDFLKKSGKPVLPQKPAGLAKTKTAFAGHLITPVSPGQQEVPACLKQANDQVGQSESHNQDVHVISDKFKLSSVTREGDFVANQRNPSLGVGTNSSARKWVEFKDQEELCLPVKQYLSNIAPKSFQANASNTSHSSISLNNEMLEQTHDFSYRSLLDKSLENELNNPEATPNRMPPELPPRLDLLPNKSPNGNPFGSLSDKLEQQAKEFEKSSQEGKRSPSLNELRAASQKSKGTRPVPPARQNKLQSSPLSYEDKDLGTGQDKNESAFPVLDELDNQITKLSNELQKETKVLSGVEVLVQMVNKDTPKRQELESKKGITERKIEKLGMQLRKIEDEKKRLVKLVEGYSSQLDMNLKVEQLQEAIKENIETKNNFLAMLSECDDKETSKDLQENISFCDKAIERIKSELDPLNDVLHQLEGGFRESSAVKENDVHRRKKVIDEILETEKSFGCDLNLCVKHFMMQLIEWKVDKIDSDLLFGNMPEIAALSSRLLQKLEAATINVDINDQIIGNCFVDFSDEMTTVYGQYCRNHDDATAFIEKATNNEEIQQYLNKCMESIREFSNCWDLSSFLIKPVQRILKYPLLLNELMKNTPNDHPDRPGLVKAIDVMTTAASDVNEFKRRKDLVQKYQKVEDSGLSTRFQKLTWHSVVKKSTRFNQRITQFTGLVSQTVDERFNEKERMFYQIEKTIKNFIKNGTQYMEQFEDVHANQVQTAENITDFYGEMANTREVKEYHDAQKCIGEDLVDNLKQVLDTEVLTPLNSLMQLFQGPHRLILKRHDKCLDYDSWTNKIDKIKDPEKWKQAKDELELAKKNYEALNVQLLDELPVFNSKALVFVQTCITNFALVHKNFFVKALDQFSASVQVSVIDLKGDEIISDFSSQSKLATHEILQLVFTSKKSGSKPIRPTASPKTARQNLSVEEKHYKTKNLKRSVSESKRRAPGPPSEEGGIVRSQTVSVRDRSLLKKKMETGTEVNPAINIIDSSKSDSENIPYVAKFAFNATASRELSMNEDDVVRVLQFHDNFGNSEWWKVERDGEIGYVPSSFLAPRGIDHAGNGMLVNSPLEYIAQYEFEARGAEEVDLAVGDVVNVLQQHDSTGNQEWWSVKVNGQHGYVPGSYLAKR